MIKRCRWAAHIVFRAILVAPLLLAFSALAQEPPDDAFRKGQSAAGEKTNGNKNSQSQEQDGKKNDRIFGVLPNYLTVEGAQETPPLTTKSKFKIAAKGSFDPYEYPIVGFFAAIAQARDQEKSWGQGAAGYGKRYGATFADQAIGNFMTGAVLPSLLRQDPRYFQLAKGGFFHRAGYALSRIFVTRTDSGGRQFNHSELAGNAVAAGISNAYRPSEDRSLANTLSTWGTQVAIDTIGNELKEFWPDIRRKLFKK